MPTRNGDISLPDETDLEQATWPLHAERLITGMVAAVPKRIAHVQTEGITSEHVLDPSCEEVLQVAEALLDEGVLGSTNVLRTRLKDEGRWGRLGGETNTNEWWSDLISNVPQADTPVSETDLASACETIRQAVEIRETLSPTLEVLDDVLLQYDPLPDRLESVRESTDEMLQARARQSETAKTGEEQADAFEAEIGQALPRSPTGFPCLDKNLSHTGQGGLIQGRFSILGGATNHGKSLGADWIAFRHAARYKKQGIEKQVVKLDMENGLDACRLRWVTMAIQHQSDDWQWAVPVADVERYSTGQGTIDQWKERAIQKGSDYLRELGDYVTMDEKRGATPTYLRGRLQTARARKEIGLVVIDYITLMHVPDTDGEETVRKAIRQVHEIAGEMNVPILVVAQLGRRTSNRPGGVPRLEDLQWSSTLEQQAATVMLVHHPYMYYKQQNDAQGFAESEYDENDAMLYVAKNKGPERDARIRTYPDHLYMCDPNDPTSLAYNAHHSEEVPFD